MGVVYRGRDVAFGREVAVKLLLAEHLDNPVLRRRFITEARITAHLQHPDIVPVYEAGEFPDGRPFYSMRLMVGQTLADLLDARPNIHDDRPHLLRVFEKVCEALAYAHSRGVIHRDVKPANVMVGEFGRVKLMDWGVAKALPHSPLVEDLGDQYRSPATAAPCSQSSGSTEFGRVVGTPAFMSPEQARGHIESLDERTDIFGAGAILAAILTGHPPYTGRDTRSVFRAAQRADLAPAFSRLASCGADVELVALCWRCLSPAPVDRPRDAGLLVREFSEYLTHDLRRSERDLVRFFELSLDLFCIAGTNGYLRRVNANFTRVLGYTTEQLLTTPFIEFVHPDDRDRTRSEMARVANGDTCVQFLNRYRDVCGNYRWFEWTGKAVSEAGVVFAVARDVTDRVRLQEALRASQGG
jgi:serine/threonine-protein kinase